MSGRKHDNENRILTLSALFASGFAALGLTVGLMVDSLVIVFDGVYSLVSVALTLLSLAAAYYIRRPSKSAFPFGKALLEPLVIMIKASAILMVVAYSVYSAMVSLMHGGHAIDFSFATIFELSGTLGCAYAWWSLQKKSDQHSSGLIRAETQQWKMDTMLSLVVAAGFVIAFILSQSPWASYAGYADPLMMLAMSFYFVKVPLDMLKGALRELLMMTPDKQLCAIVDSDIMLVEKLSNHHLTVAGITKVGHELKINVDLHTDKQVIQLKEIERTRAQLKRALSRHADKLQLTLNIAA